MATARPLIPAFMKPFAEDDFPRGQRRDSTYEYRTIIHKSGPRRICWTLLDRTGDCDNDVISLTSCPPPANSRRLLTYLPLVIAWLEKGHFALFVVLQCTTDGMMRPNFRYTKRAFAVWGRTNLWDSLRRVPERASISKCFHFDLRAVLPSDANIGLLAEPHSKPQRENLKISTRTP
jgi:hypothetical protein